MTLIDFLNQFNIEILPDLNCREWQRSGAQSLRVWVHTIQGNTYHSAFVQDFREDLKEWWYSTDDATVIEQIRQHKREADGEIDKEVQQATSREVQKFLATLSSEGLTPYLERKGIDRLYGDAKILSEDGTRKLFVPMRNKDEVRSYQRILPSKPEVGPDKKYRSGVPTKGLYCLIGAPLPGSTIYIAEGYATACSIHMATGEATVCAFDAGNLEPVADTIREQYRDAKLVICADNDQWNKINVGLDKARLAAKKVVAEVRKPYFLPKERLDKPTDFNDLFLFRGAKEVLRQLTIVKYSPDVGDGEMVLESVEDLLDSPDEELQYLVHGLLPFAGSSVLGGQPKAGKTTLSRGLAMSVAVGGEFLGRKVTKGKVIYIAVEEKRSEVKNHFKRMGVNKSQLANILIWCKPTPSEIIDHLFELILVHNPALIILDTLFKIIRIENENAYSEVANALHVVSALARGTGVHIMCLHHLGKSPRPRAAGLIGSTAIEGNSDTNIIMNCDDDGRRTLLTSQRYGDPLPETVLQFDKARGLMALGAMKFEVEKNDIAERIVEVLRVNGLMRHDELKDEVKGNARKFGKCLDALIQSQQVIKQGVKGSRDTPLKYSLDANWKAPTPCEIDREACENAF